MSTPLAVAAGCSEEPAGDACLTERFDAQAKSRFIVGQTFYLPTVSTASDCAGTTWKLETAPPENKNIVLAGADGVPRFTPHVKGLYSFRLGETDVVQPLGVLEPEAFPFHNLNYFPGQSVAEVSGEIWTANVTSPTISRLDPATLAFRGSIHVGAWPVAIAWAPGMKHAVVAHRGGDTLGLVDTESGRIEDAIWVGDEPSNVIVSPDGRTAYVTLSTERFVAVVDIEARAVRARIPTGWDPLAMAITKDGSTLFVASHRSGQPSRYPFGDDPVEEEKDITVIDTASASVKATFLDVGATINALLLAEDNTKLFVAATRSDPSVSLADTSAASFRHMVIALDAATGKELASADLTRQASSGGFAVSTHGMALDGDKLWVAAEGSDLAVALDVSSLEETARVEAPGRPRGVTSAGGAVLVHGAQGFALTRIAAGGTEVIHGETGLDPRPEVVARGQRLFTGSGRDYGQNWSCNNCHADGLTDTIPWKAGPFDFRAVTRPQFWLEGADRLGWSGYVANVKDFGWAIGSTIGIWPTTSEAEGLAAYLASLMPPPAANGLTRRDGSLSEAGLRGKALYEGKAACNGCHALPLATNKEIYAEGITPGETDVPSLVGAYRHGVWLKHGEARTLRQAVEMVLDYLKNTSLSEAEIDDLTRYVEELTARDFFVLSSDPKEGAVFAFDEPIRLTMSHPVWGDPSNLARIRLVDASGKVVPAKVLGSDGRHLTITPDAPLAPASDHAIVIAAGLESLEEMRLPEEKRISFKTSEAPSLKLDGDYVWTTQMPIPNFETKTFDLSKTIPVLVSIKAESTGAGARLTVDYGKDLLFDTTALIQGAAFVTPPMPVPAGNNLGDTRGLSATLIDDDKDGIADRATGKLRLSGPGFDTDGIFWELARPVGDDVCEEGASGSLPVAVTTDKDGVTVIDWGAELGLGVYVTSPAATLPTGPGTTVMNGATYWSIQLEKFPNGFAGPVTYQTVPAGAVDTTAENGGKAGGVPLVSGTCYKFSVITTQFTQGQFIIRWP